VVEEVWRSYGTLSGRLYSNVYGYRLEDAEVAIVTQGSTVGTARYAATMLREKGVRAGVLGVRLYRPFPSGEVARALGGVKTVAVLDHALSFGAVGGPLFSDIVSSLYPIQPPPTIVSFVCGLGGRDVTWELIASAASRAVKAGEEKELLVGTQFLGVYE